MVVERSGYSAVPRLNASNGGEIFDVARQRRRLRRADLRRAGAAYGSEAIRRRHSRRNPRIEPDRRVVIAERQRNGRSAGGQRRRRVDGFARAAAPCRAARAHPESRETWIAPAEPGSAKAGCRSCLVLPAHQREEFDLAWRQRAAPRAPAPPSGARGSARARTARARCGLARAASSASQQRDQAGFLAVAPEHVAEADFAGRKPHGARDTVASPKLNGAPSPPMRPRSITSPLSRRAELRVRGNRPERRKMPRDLLRAACGEHRHRFAAALAHLQLVG